MNEFFFPTVFLTLYRALIWPLARLVFLVLRLAGNEKVRRGFELRKPDANQVWPWLKGPKNSRPVWIHCASGEFEYAKPVIRELKAKHPTVPTLVTYFSPSFVNAIAKFPGVDFYCPLPWDSSDVLAEFFTFYQPRCLIIARTDTWPEMLAQARIHKVPALLFSAVLAQDSSKTRFPGSWVTRSILSFLNDVFSVTEDDRKAFESIGIEAKVCGDTRYDQAIERLKTSHAVRTDLFSVDTSLPVLVAGSTWIEDEAVLIPTAQRLKDRVRFIFVPHEPTPHHLQDLEHRLRNAGLSSVRYSSAQTWNKGEVLIVDQMGILAELYARGQLAFVGGSFRKSVHSVMEPLASGCLTFLGPKHLNNREALEFKKIQLNHGHTCVEIVHSSDEMAQRISSYLEEQKSSDREFIKSEIQKRSGKSKLVVEWIENHL